MLIIRRKAVQLFGGARSAADPRRSFAMGLGHNAPASIPVKPRNLSDESPIAQGIQRDDRRDLRLCPKALLASRRPTPKDLRKAADGKDGKIQLHYAAEVNVG